MSQFYGRYTLVAGKTTPVLLPTDGIAAVVISNDSAFSVVATLEGAGSSINIPAGVADMMPVQNRSFTGNLLLAATTQLTIQNSPSNYVEINIYGIGEQVPSVYPLSLNRLSNTGNDLGSQGVLRATSRNTLNGGFFHIGGAMGQIAYLKSLLITVSRANAAADGELTISGLDPTIVDGGTLYYEISCAVAEAMAPIRDEFMSPLPGIAGNILIVTGPAALSTAMVGIVLTYYLN